MKTRRPTSWLRCLTLLATSSDLKVPPIVPLALGGTACAHRFQDVTAAFFRALGFNSKTLSERRPLHTVQPATGRGLTRVPGHAGKRGWLIEWNVRTRFYVL